jgi:hypothetical protein
MEQHYYALENCIPHQSSIFGLSVQALCTKDIATDQEGTGMILPSVQFPAVIERYASLPYVNQAPAFFVIYFISSISYL